jgi:hypothetical protein
MNWGEHVHDQIVSRSTPCRRTRASRTGGHAPRRECPTARHFGRSSLTGEEKVRAPARSKAETAKRAKATSGDRPGVANSACDFFSVRLFENWASYEAAEGREERSNRLATWCRSGSESAPRRPRRPRWRSSMLTVASVGRAWTAGRCPSRRGCSAGGSVPSPSASHAWGMNHGRPRARTCRQSPRLNCLQRARRSSSLSPSTRGETARRPSPGRVDVGTSTRADQLSRITSAGQPRR